MVVEKSSEATVQAPSLIRLPLNLGDQTPRQRLLFDVCDLDVSSSHAPSFLTLLGSLLDLILSIFSTSFTPNFALASCWRMLITSSSNISA